MAGYVTSGGYKKTIRPDPPAGTILEEATQTRAVHHVSKASLLTNQ